MTQKGYNLYPGLRVGVVSKDARKAVEKETGQSVVSPLNAKQIAQREGESDIGG